MSDARSSATRIVASPAKRTASCDASSTGIPSGANRVRNNITNASPWLRAGSPYASTAARKARGSAPLPLASSSRRTTSRRSPSGARDIGVPGAGASAARSSSTPPERATTVTAASAKSASSVAAQNTAAVGMPVRASISSASASALIALLHVYKGPPKSPGCCPVVTTTPPWRLTRSSRAAAAPVGMIAGSSASHRVGHPASRARARASARHSPVDRGRTPVQSTGASSRCSRNDRRDPPSGCVMMWTSVTDGVRREWCAAHQVAWPCHHRRRGRRRP